MSESRFYNCCDIMEICECSKYKAYDLIRKWNAELEAKGYTTIQGKVVRRFADSKLGFNIQNKEDYCNAQ
jgi:hypothetical protein